MQTMQQRITETVEKAVHEAGHDLVMAGSSAVNVVKWTAPQRGDVFAQNGRCLTANFQSGYATFTSYDGDHVAMIKYDEPGRANAKLAKVIDFLLGKDS